MRYKAILMDADQTILDFNAAERHAVDRLFARHGITHPDAYRQYHQINLDCWAAFEEGKLTLDDLKYVRFDRFCALHLPGTDTHSIAEEYDGYLAQQGDLIPHAEEMLRDISARLPIAIVTNGTVDIQYGRINPSPIRPYIRHVIISEEVGHRKPEPRMIHLALEKLGIDNPSDALMIGDSLTSDMPAARDAGVDFLWFNPGGRPCPPGAHITYEARDVRDFVPIALMD